MAEKAALAEKSEKPAPHTYLNPNGVTMVSRASDNRGPELHAAPRTASTAKPSRRVVGQHGAHRAASPRVLPAQTWTAEEIDAAKTKVKAWLVAEAEANPGLLAKTTQTVTETVTDTVGATKATTASLVTATAEMFGGVVARISPTTKPANGNGAKEII